MSEAAGTAGLGPVRLPTDQGDPGSLRKAAARMVWALHTAIVALVVTAWALPWAQAWWAVALLAPAMQIQWWLNNDVCILTSLERWLRQETEVSDESDEQEGSFVGRLLESIVGELSPRAVNRISIGINTFSGSVCALRLIFQN